jgi:anti-anti-sigma factor
MAATDLYIFSANGNIQIIELRLPLQMDVLMFDDLNSALLSHIVANRGDYLIDLSRTDYVGSAVLGLLVNVRQKVRAAGGRLVLCQLSPRILEIFRIGSLQQLFTLATTRDEALALLAAK